AKDINKAESLILHTPKQAYIIHKASNIIDGEYVTGVTNWTKLPIFPMYANREKKSEFSLGLKNKIDLYDIIISDFGNNLEDSQDVYWVLKNYQGQDITQFMSEYKRYKAIKVESDEDGNGGDATPHTIEIPYQAREIALNLLEKKIYKEAMALDTESITGSSLTNVVIKAAFTDLNTKCDAFENCVLITLKNIVDLYKEYAKVNKDIEIKLIRRELVNDTETVDNIVKFRNDIDWRTSLELNPYISTKDIDIIEKRMEEEASTMFNRGATPNYMQQEEEDNKPNKANEEE
ncbi:phage portal protein, partial [Clostridium chrysemydis]